MMKRPPQSVFYLLAVLIISSVWTCSGFEKRDLHSENYGKDFGDLEKNYEQLLKNCTRHGRIKINHTVPVQVRVTYRSSMLREAFVQRCAKLHGLKPYEQEALKLEEENDLQDAEEFFFSLHGQEKDWCKLTPQSLTPWIIYLNINQNLSLKPTRIKEIFNPQADLFIYYRPLSSWANNYIVYFNHPDPEVPLINQNAEKFQIIMTGAPGRIVLTWKAEELRHGVVLKP